VIRRGQVWWVDFGEPEGSKPGYRHAAFVLQGVRVPMSFDLPTPFAPYCGAVKGRDGWGGMNVPFGNLTRAIGEINVSTGSARARAVFPLFFG